MKTRAVTLFSLSMLMASTLASAQEPQAKAKKRQIRYECEIQYAMRNMHGEDLHRPSISMFQEKHYRPDGLLTKNMEHMFAGCFEEEEYESYIYNAQGKCVERWVLDEEGRPTGERWIYTYNEEGHCIRTEYYQNSSNKTPQFTTHHHNDKGQLEEQKNYNNFGRLDSRTRYRYNGKGLLEEKLGYNLSGQLHSRTHYRYNHMGKLLEEALYQADTLESRKSYAYDTAGRCIEEENYYNNKVQSYEQKIYNETGQLLEKRSGWDKEKLRRYVYRYDSLGRAAGLRVYNTDGELETEEIPYYDNEGFVFKSRAQHYRKWDKSIELKYFSYDNKEHVVEELVFRNLDKKRAKAIEKVGSISKLLAWRKLGEHILLRYHYEYNADGLVTLVIRDEYRSGYTQPLYTGFKTIAYYD